MSFLSLIFLLWQPPSRSSLAEACCSCFVSVTPHFLQISPKSLYQKKTRLRYRLFRLQRWQGIRNISSRMASTWSMMTPHTRSDGPKKFVSKKARLRYRLFRFQSVASYPQHKFKNGFNLAHVDSTYRAFSSDGPKKFVSKKALCDTDFLGSKCGKLSPT